MNLIPNGVLIIDSETEEVSFANTSMKDGLTTEGLKERLKAFRRHEEAGGLLGRQVSMSSRSHLRRSKDSKDEQSLWSYLAESAMKIGTVDTVFKARDPKVYYQ